MPGFGRASQFAHEAQEMLMPGAAHGPERGIAYLAGLFSVRLRFDCFRSECGQKVSVAPVVRGRSDSGCAGSRLVFDARQCEIVCIRESSLAIARFGTEKDGKGR
jgi:hypothetical protein